MLLRAIDRFGHEGPAELGKVEALLSALDQAAAESSPKRRPRDQPTDLPKNQPKLKRTLAGALVSLFDDRISIAPAPPRRRRRD
jgi:tRNA(Ile)-lysidine synthase